MRGRWLANCAYCALIAAVPTVAAAQTPLAEQPGLTPLEANAALRKRPANRGMWRRTAVSPKSSSPPRAARPTFRTRRSRVSAIDQSLIKQSSPRDLGELAAFVPNFSAGTITNFNAASFAIRGVG